jgi:hypothetical protein
MKKLAGVVLLIAAAAIGARAQETPAVEASAGYSYLRIGGSDGTNQNGASGSAAFNVSNWLGVVGDFGGYHSSPQGVSINTYTYMFGPRVSYRTRTGVTPFAEMLFGGSHMSASAFGATGTVNPFAYSFGGGVDLRLSGHWALRPEAEYVGLRSNGSTANCGRFDASIVYRWGGR